MSIRSHISRFAFIAFMIFGSVTLYSQSIMLEGWYWDYPVSIDGQRFGQYYPNFIPDFVDAGFNYIWLPPLSRASQGINSPGLGYDVMDYYDLGEYGQGPTRFGTRQDVENVVAALHQNGIQVIADMVYNQRAGGQWEDNPVVQNYITSMTLAKIDSGYQPYPSDRFQCYLRLGGTTGNGPGTYYFQFRSASRSPIYYNFPYTVQMNTTRTQVTSDSLNDSYEVEPNNGGGCNDTDNYYYLGTRKYAHLDSTGCGIDQFRLVLDTSMYYTAGDILYISMKNTNPTSLSDYSDHYLYGVYNGANDSDITAQVVYQTGTDFTHMPSGQGTMTRADFKPDGNPTMLAGNWDEMIYFNDLDQYVPSTITTLTDWQEWMFDSVGIDGMRLDAVKNYTYAFTAQNLDSLHAYGHNPDMIVGEYSDYDPNSLNAWITNVKNLMSASTKDSITPRVFDFALRQSLQSACDQSGYDVRNVFTSGMVDGSTGSGANAVTWVNNHDLRDSTQPISDNPELAYAYILSNDKIGTPCVYLLDYQASNFLRGRIKGLMHDYKKYIAKSDEVDYLTAVNSTYTSTFNSGLATTTLIFQLHNTATGRAVVAAINFAEQSLDVYQKVNTNYLAAGDTLTDIFGINQPVTNIINSSGQLHVTLPPRSFTVWVQGNLSDSLISLGDTLIPITPNPTAVNNVPVADNLLSVFPNPFSSQVNISLNAPVNGMMSVEIYDLSGRQLYIKQLLNPDGLFTIYPPVTSAGVYIMKVTANGTNHFYKLIKD